MTEPKRWTVQVSEKRADLTGWDHTLVEVVAAADFDRLRAERDRWKAETKNMRQLERQINAARIADLERVAGVLADAHRRIADLPIVDDSDADRMREIAVAALAAADREENTDA